MLSAICFWFYNVVSGGGKRRLTDEQRRTFMKISLMHVPSRYEPFRSVGRSIY